MINLPTERREAKSSNADSMIIYGLPKQGKSAICAQLPNCLYIALGSESVDKLAVMDYRINNGDLLKDVYEFAALLRAIEEKNTANGGFFYDYIVLDSLTRMDEMSEVAGTVLYEQTTQGKKWNAKKDGLDQYVKDKDGNYVKYAYGDVNWEPVTSMGEGYGYRWTRNWMTDKFHQLLRLAPSVVFLCHVQDKFIQTKSGDKVQAIDLQLTGKLKSILASEVDAVGYFHRKGNQGFLSFKADGDRVAGNRCPHLQGDILISEKQENNTVKTYWDKIYIPQTIKQNG